MPSTALRRFSSQGGTKGARTGETRRMIPIPGWARAEDLRNAIEACRQMGVEVILFNKYTWADSTTEWYRKELYRYAARDPYGDTYTFGGYDYDTPAQLSEINTRHLIGMCTACPAWREIAFKEFHKERGVERRRYLAG